MFWNRSKTLNLKWLNTLSISAPTAPQPETAPDLSNDAKANSDLAFKLVASAAWTVQAALLVYGYSTLVGSYDRFGIDINEIALGTPTLLLYGYVNVWSGTISAANSLPILGPFLLAAVFIVFAGLCVKTVAKRLPFPMVLGISTWIGLMLFTAFMAPATGVQRGLRNGLDDFKTYTGLDAPNGLDRSVTVTIDTGSRLTGHLILVDNKNMFLLVDRTVYKIEGQTGHVIRETQLSPKAPRPDVQRNTTGEP